MKKSAIKYSEIEKILIEKGYVSKTQSDIISRRGTRKETYWKRHILDLCGFVLDQRIVDDETKDVINEYIGWARS